MSLNINNGNQTPVTDNAQTQQSAEPVNRNWSFHSTGIFSSPISSTLGSEYFNKLRKALVEVYKTANDDVEIALLDLDNATYTALVYSALIVACRFKRAPGVVAYHILIVKASGPDTIKPVYDNYNGEQIEIIRVASDAVDEKLIAIARKRVSDAFPNATVLHAESCIVPTNFNTENQYALQRLAANAGLACTSELIANDPNAPKINLTTVSRDSVLSVNLQFARNQLENAVGEPIRSDAIVQFASKKNTANAKDLSLNTNDREIALTELSGFVDTVWSPVENMSVFNPYMMQQPMATQKYVARFVITDLRASFNNSLESVLLALSTSVSMRDDNNWIQVFRPIATSQGEMDLSDIGALNIEANLNKEANGFGTRIDTKASDFKLQDLGTLVAALIRPGLMLSIDVPKAGPQAWYLSVFAAAARGSRAAYDLIINAANNLTGGNFGRYFQPGQSIFVDTDNIVHLGHWIDRNGQQRDIRDIDHIAVCNLVGERNPTLIRQWADSFLNTRIPVLKRLSDRKKMISGLTNEKAVFTGVAERVTFATDFIQAISNAIRDVGLPVRITTPLTMNDFNDQRGVASFVNSALMQSGQGTFISPNNIGYNSQFSNYNIGGQWRW